MRHFSREQPACLRKWEGSPIPSPSYPQRVLVLCYCLRALCPTPLHLAGVCAPKFCTQTATRNTGSEVWQARHQVSIWGERLPLQCLALS